MNATTADPYALADLDDRYEPGFTPSIVLALAVHLILVGILFFGVRWQSHRPSTIAVELWRPPPAAPSRIEQPAPRPVPKVAPPAPERAKPEPRIEKPDIAIKEPPKPKPKPPPKPVAKPKPAPKPAAKPSATVRAADAAYQRRLREQLARESTTISQQRREAEIRDLLARDSGRTSQIAIDGWVAKVQAKIRGNIVLPPDLQGNPEAIFDVVQLPTGEVLTVRLRKSSGHVGYDRAVERAILKASPLPRPEQRALFRRDLELKFRPREQ